MKYIITGGGTGGHIYPALSIADEIKKSDKDAEILYVGTKEGLEAQIVPKTGYLFKTIRVKGLPRRINKQSFDALITLLKGLKDAKKILKEFRPDYVIGTGGYVSAPMVYQAAKRGVKTVIQEQNAYPGMANKVLAKKADRVWVAFEEAKIKMKQMQKTIVMGNPIRTEFVRGNQEEAKESLGFNAERPLIVATGGSGGQRSINEAVLQNLHRWENSGYSVLLITGNRFIEETAKYIKEHDIEKSDHIQILAYSHDMPKVLSAADVVIASSSAMTMAEISAMGIPAILVPKSYTAEDHQVYNAKAYENKGAAVMIKENELNEDSLAKQIENILENEEIYRNMQKNMKQLGQPNAVKIMIEDLYSIE